MTDQSVKDIHDGKYIVLAYIRPFSTLVFPLPAFFPFNSLTEFGMGRKMFNYDYVATADGANFLIQITLGSTDGSPVTPYQGNWVYRLVFVGVDGGEFKSAVSTDALREELQQLSYEEVCERYGIEL